MPTIYKVYRDTGSSGWGYSYLVTRPEGNIFLARMGKGAAIANEYDAIDALGGISAIYITDFHFAGEHVEQVAQRFKTTIYCSEIEAPKIQKRGVTHLSAFPYTQHAINPQLMVIPSPGHTTGGVCYLLAQDEKRYLFTGDLLYFDGKQWIVGSKTYSKVKETLARLQTLDYDYLVGCGDDALGRPYVEFTPDIKKSFFEQLMHNFD